MIPDSSCSSTTLNESVRKLAAGDFDAHSRIFEAAGFTVTNPAHGILQITADDRKARRGVLISVGVHGDETSPIEMLAYILETLSHEPHALAVDLMVCIGNPEAVAAGRRFIDADLNRMFRPQRGTLANAAEATRADVMINATNAFFKDAGPERWHLDLHTAIRPSLYPTFAIVPDVIKRKIAMIDWLGQAAIEAVILNPQSAGTYSYYTAEHCAAAASTMELGRIGVLGQNDLSQFADVMRATDDLLRGTAPRPAKTIPKVFTVAQEIIKLSDDFTMAFDGNTQNFTALAMGNVIATDGKTVYRVKHAEELLVFPNPNVHVGLRAGLMVVRKT